MNIIDQIGRDEGPLRKGRSIHVRCEIVKVSDTSGPSGGVGDAVVDDQRRVLSDKVGVRAR